MMKLKAWDVTLTIRGPILTTSSAPQEFGIDAPFARNAADKYYLAGSLVKGRLKEAWKELESAVPRESCKWHWTRWLGRDPKKGEEWDSLRGTVHFADFIYISRDETQKTPESKTLYRIRKDDATEAVAFGQNQMISTPFLSNGLYCFKGRIWSILDDQEAAALEVALKQGLSWIPGIGADHTVGFGVVQDFQLVKLNQADYIRASGFEMTPESDTWWIAIKPDGPLCIGGKRIADNIFESTQEIPGGVIKGAIADAILRSNGDSAREVALLAEDKGCELKELCAEFSKVRILHATPAKTETRKRAMAIPASAAKWGDPLEMHDLAVHDFPIHEKALQFRIDWKTEPPETFDIATAPYELRVRTQISAESRRAEDANLFAYRMVAASGLIANKEEDGGGFKVESFEWLTAISFENIEDDKARKQAKEQLCKLLSEVGIPGIGKLKTYCAVERTESVIGRESIPVDLKREANVWVITLQSPALLCDVECAGSGLTNAFDVYRAYWFEESGNSLVLRRHFATQHLAGGEYQWRHLNSASEYRPFVLTDAGAVFVLSAAEGMSPLAQKKIDDWKKRGLPVARNVRQQFCMKGDETDWSRCPYIPENGYGEIAVDLAWHWKEVQG